MKRLLPKYLAWLIAAGAMLVGGDAQAGARVPFGLQAQLVSKVGSFDRNFAARADGTARVLVLYKSGDVESTRFATNFARSLDDLANVGGIPAQVVVAPFVGATELADRCRDRRVALVFLSSGLEGDMAAMGAALNGVDVLTVGASGELAVRGAVVGFDLEEGRPRIVVNLRHAKAQNVFFKAELLKLARIVN